MLPWLMSLQVCPVARRQGIGTKSEMNEFGNRIELVDSH